MPQSQDTEQLLSRALQLQGQGKYQDAIEALKKVLALDKKHAKAHLHLGLVYGFVGMFDESLAELEEAISCDPVNVEAYMNLGKTLCMLGMYDEARKAFQTILAMQPANTEAKKQLAYLPPQTGKE
jgi:tetratricopeptide (TPR) repeat protein